MDGWMAVADSVNGILETAASLFRTIIIHWQRKNLPKTPSIGNISEAIMIHWQHILSHKKLPPNIIPAIIMHNATVAYYQFMYCPQAFGITSV